MIPEDDFIQGAEIVLTCALSGGTSNPGSVTWLKDNQPVNQLNLQNVVVVSEMAYLMYNVCICLHIGMSSHCGLHVPGRPSSMVLQCKI